MFMEQRDPGFNVHSDANPEFQSQPKQGVAEVFSSCVGLVADA